MIHKEEHKLEDYKTSNEMHIKSDKTINNDVNKIENKESSKKQGYIEIKLNLFDFKEKIEKKQLEKKESINDKKNILQVKESNDTKRDIFNKNNNSEVKDKSIIINTTNVTNVASSNNNYNNNSFIKKETENIDNSTYSNNNNYNNNNNNSLLEKLLKSNNINLNKIDTKSKEKNKTSENFLGNVLNTYQSDESCSFILNNNNKQIDNCKENILKNEKLNNFQISSILSFGKLNKKLNKLDSEKSRKISEKMYIKNKKKDMIENIPLWIENNNNDLDFSVNTVFYDRKDNKLSSMPNNFTRDPNEISDSKTDNYYNFEVSNQIFNNNNYYNNSQFNNESSQINLHYEKSLNNVNKSQNFNFRGDSELLIGEESSKKQFFTNYENFNDQNTDSYNSLMLNQSKASQIIGGDNESFDNQNNDSAEETVCIRREDSKNKKDEKNDILIVIF